MFALHFEKVEALRFLEALNSGTPIPVPAGGWNRHAMVTLAAACIFAVRSHKPERLHASSIEPEHPERTEAVQESFDTCLQGALGFLSGLCRQAFDDDHYDESYGPIVEAVLMLESAGTPPTFGIQAHKGFKTVG